MKKVWNVGVTLDRIPKVDRLKKITMPFSGILRESFLYDLFIIRLLKYPSNMQVGRKERINPILFVLV